MTFFLTSFGAPRGQSEIQSLISCRSSKCEGNGRPEWIRTIDLFRVKEALWTS